MHCFKVFILTFDWAGNAPKHTILYVYQDEARIIISSICQCSHIFFHFSILLCFVSWNLELISFYMCMQWLIGCCLVELIICHVRMAYEWWNMWIVNVCTIISKGNGKNAKRNFSLCLFLSVSALLLQFFHCFKSLATLTKKNSFFFYFFIVHHFCYWSYGCNDGIWTTESLLLLKLFKTQKNRIDK